MTPESPADPLRPYAGVTVLLTGATGFIGRWVWRLLAGAGAEVRPVGRSPEALRAAADELGVRADPVVADLACPGAAREAWLRVRPDVAFNLAGYGVGRGERDPGLHLRINTELPAELGEAAAAHGGSAWGGQRVVHVGSAFEYGSVPGPVTEATEPAPATLYGVSKLEGTRRLAAVRERTGLRGVTVRVCTVYGPGEHPHRLLPSLLRAAATGEELALTAGEQERDFTCVRDVAEGILRVGLLPEAPPVVNLATGVLTTVRAFAEQVMAAAGIDPYRVRFGALAYRPDEVWQGPVSTELLERLLGWLPPTSVADGIRAACERLTPERGVRP